MEGITHFLTGILILKYLKGKIKHPYDKILIIVLSFLSHGILDSLARATYHPSNALLNDPIWWIWHITVYVLGLAVFIHYFKECWYALIASSLPDIWDWGIIRPTRDWIIQDPSWGASFFMHQYIYIIPRAWFDWLPDMNLNPIGIIPEIILIIILSFLIYLKIHKEKELIEEENEMDINV